MIEKLDTIPLQRLIQKIDEMITRGWTLDDRVGDVRISMESNAVQESINELAEIQQSIQSTEVIGERNGQSIRLRIFSGRPQVMDLPSVDPYSIFEDEDDHDAVERAWDRDADAALALPMDWIVIVRLGTDKLPLINSDLEVRIAYSPETIVREICSTALTEVGRLIPDTGKRRVYIALQSTAIAYHFGTFSLASANHASTLSVPEPRQPLAGESIAYGAGVPFPQPYHFIETDSQQPLAKAWAPAVKYVKQISAIATWITLASKAEEASTEILVTFSGLKSAKFALSSSILEEEKSIEETLLLRQWALQEISPDRLLAVRQVVSLYVDEEPIYHADEIQSSAEVVYIGLRSEAVNEAVKSSREAKTQVNDAVRQAIKSSQDLTKSAIERFLAGFVAIGGTIAADATHSISPNTSRILIVLVAIFFVILATISTLVDGPLLSLQMKHLSSDIESGSYLLSKIQMEKIINSPSAKDTRARIRRVRITTPVLYLLLSLASWYWFSRIK